jgi:hypothetical protein
MTIAVMTMANHDDYHDRQTTNGDSDDNSDHRRRPTTTDHG